MQDEKKDAKSAKEVLDEIAASEQAADLGGPLAEETVKELAEAEETVTVSTKDYLDLQERLKVVEARVQKPADEQIKQLGALTAPKTEEDIEKFTSGKWFLPEREPYEIFARDWAYGIGILPGGKEYDEVVRRDVQKPELKLTFARWRGPGAEFPDPSNASQGLFPWGHFNLLDLPLVVSPENPAGIYEVDFVLAALMRCNLWRETAIFPAAIAVIEISAHYEKVRVDKDRLQDVEARMKKTKAMLLKTGRVEPATNEQLRQHGFVPGAPVLPTRVTPSGDHIPGAAEGDGASASSRVGALLGTGGGGGGSPS